MSAFVVSDNHIDALVRVALCGPAEVDGSGRAPLFYGVQFAGRDITFGRADEVGAALVRENVASVNSRYRETKAVPPYSYGSAGARLTAVQALKAVHCYEYQACEHPEWEASAAFKFCGDLKNSLHNCLPGWDVADWGID
jgi:hypothetical protein